MFSLAGTWTGISLNQIEETDRQGRERERERERFQLGALFLHISSQCPIDAGVGGLYSRISNHSPGSRAKNFSKSPRHYFESYSLEYDDVINERWGKCCIRGFPIVAQGLKERGRLRKDMNHVNINKIYEGITKNLLPPPRWKARSVSKAPRSMPAIFPSLVAHV